MFGETGRETLLKWVKLHLEHSGARGSYFEFGVYNGRSLIKTYDIFKDSLNKYIGFDSFQGLPALEATDKEFSHLQQQFQKGVFRSKGKDALTRELTQAGIPVNRLSLVEGFFLDTLTKDLQSKLLKETKASLVHLDVDLHASTKQALDFIVPFLQTGTWLLCDDYWCYAGSSQAGTQRAIKEFLEENPKIKLQDYCNYRGWSKAFIVECLLKPGESC